ncbi:hypothetical protein HNQ60_004871 [Povalibacter uvarum]|uniref:DUF4440 domain-containing protein n=1 Tax=Povalibacter uvarum TaxID=732238 RepID=A0A841HUV8_9GAMM|nr:hypothetical protein [Povalibacter uvarum]MBB6095980.1 hypothetical protein [Povalibacter uvarum]
MRWCVLSLSLLLTGPPALAASDSAQTWVEIDRAIWQPFVRGVSTFNHELYGAVRAKDSIFVDGKRFFGYDAYIEDAVRVMTPLQRAGTRIEMQVRFEDRTTDGSYASERGVLQTIITDARGERRVGHARSHVISRKQPDGWRIVTDYRWRTTPEADAKAFEEARAQ